MELSCVNKQSQVNTKQARNIIQPITDIADQTWHIPVGIKLMLKIVTSKQTRDIVIVT